MTGARDRRLAGAICEWFARARRPLPWRPPAGPTAGPAASSGQAPPALRNPYHALVSEAMLQQTQAARVAERFGPFIERFGTVEALAGAGEQEVLGAWTGLGYYRRARLLHQAARAIVQRHGAQVPADVEALRALPGVGRYTAGAISSICFDRPEPIVDGNVARVLLRIEGREAPAGERDTERWLWERAGALVKGSAGVGGPALFNEGLMELGAVVCLPRSPRCDACPLARWCRARAAGAQGRIPAPKPAAQRKVIRCATVIVTDERGRVLVDRRPARGLWADMWQAPTLEVPGDGRAIARRRIEQWLGVCDLAAGEPFEFLATHRRLKFVPWQAPRLANGLARGLRDSAEARAATESRFVTRRELAGLAMSSPQRRILQVEQVCAHGARMG
ncbi:MAG: A/G-specific adenine glycosylase [Phycisphaerales bacterium JB039]